MSEIKVNNRDRKDYKIRTNLGIIGRNENLNKHADNTRIDFNADGIIPFTYIDRNGEEKITNECVRGAFYFQGELVKPLPGLWCASKVDSDGNMIEWGYCIDTSKEITSLQEAIDIVKELQKEGETNSFIVGWLKTYTLNKKLLNIIKTNPEINELLRNKEKIPNVNLYNIGDELMIRGKIHILEDSLEYGKRWKLKSDEGDIIVKPSGIKRIKLENQDDIWYGTNKDQSGSKIIHSYQGIIHRDFNQGRRGLERRQEMTKECIFPFDYINNENKRITMNKCATTGMSIEGYQNRYPGDPWCATEIDDTGLMREWGFCTRNKINREPNEKDIWQNLCTYIKNEQWTNAKEIVIDLLNDGLITYDIINTINDLCNRKTISLHIDKLVKLIDTEYIKLKPWHLIYINEKPIHKYFKVKSNLTEIIIGKLKKLGKNYNLDLHNDLINKNKYWLVNYYFVIERIIAEGMLSQNLKKNIINLVKQTEDISKLNEILLEFETRIKKLLKPFIESIDKSGVNVNFNNKPVNVNQEINKNLIIISYATFFYPSANIEKRELYYDILDVSKNNLAEQLMFYNKSFVEPEIEDINLDLEFEPKETYESNEESNEESYVESESANNNEGNVMYGGAYDKVLKKWENTAKEFFSHYPEINDPLFYLKIQRKQEFKTNKGESWKNKKIEDICRVDTFELSPQQQWISNFFNPETPYKGLLLWWGTGVGKTCASISIAEKHLDYYKKFNKKILVILGTSTLENYKKELYNFKKEKIEIAKGLPPGTLQCTKNRYYMPIVSNNPALLKKREQKILKRIQQDYEFITYGSLKGILSKLLQRRGIKLEYEGDKSIEPKKKPKEVGEEIKVGNKSFVAVKTLRGILIWKKLEEEKDLVKEKRIKLAISEYFSNRLIIVDEIQNIRTAGEGGDAIAPQMLEKIIHYSDDIKLVMMSATPMFNNATEITYILNLLLDNDKRLNDKKEINYNGQDIKLSSIFDSKGNVVNEKLLDFVCRGYISYVRGANPISFPLRLSPNQSPIDFIRENNEIYYPRPLTKMNGTPFLEEEYIRYNPLVKCDMSAYQEAIFRRAILGEEDSEGNKADNTNETFDIKGKVISNIVYPSKDKKDLENLFGEKGFNNCFVEENNLITYSDNAIVNGKPFLDIDNIQKYSCKFKKILDNILHTPNGIIFVYSEYKKGGSIPLALALEQNGFSQLVVEGKYAQGIVKNKLNSPYRRKDIPVSEEISSNIPRGGWRYVLLDGDLEPKKRAQILEKCNSVENKNGDIIKVIIGTRVAGEGVDFARIRQVHILNPWDNMSRIDQIFGRGIRNCSHKDLPEEDRNVTTFLYSAHIKDNSVETTDEKIHRRAEKKDIQMKQVEVIMRNSSIDCVSNQLANRYTIEDFGDELGDKDGQRECAYGNCDELFVCKDNSRIAANNSIDYDTFNIETHVNKDINKYKQYIRELFKKSVIFSLEQIKDYIINEKKIKQAYDEDIFLISLDKLIRNREIINDKYNRNGTLVFRKGYYVFQPEDLSKTKKLPIYYRETPLTIKEIKVEVDTNKSAIDEELVKKWVKEVKQIILETENEEELAYELDRVKDIVMKEIIKDWFKKHYEPNLIKYMEIQDRLFRYFENKNILIMDEDSQNIIGMNWNSNVSYEYLVDRRELKEHIDSDIFKPNTELINIRDYSLETHIIGKLQKISDGTDDSYQHEVKFKILDFNYFKGKTNLKLDGKECKTYKKNELETFAENLELDLTEENGDKKSKLRTKDICKELELELRKRNNNKKYYENKTWWMESHIPYVLEK